MSNFDSISDWGHPRPPSRLRRPEGSASSTRSTEPGGPGGVGLTTAVSVLDDGYVVVGSLPVTEQDPDARGRIAVVLNSAGVPVETSAGHGTDGTWT